MADHAIARIRMLHAVAPDKPWVTYYAPGTAHAPHHAPKDWIAKFKGQFDLGWDKMREETFARQKKLGIIPPNTQLTPRPKDIPAWDSLDADHKKVYAHMMEVYAAALSYCDTQMGRVLDAIEDMGELDNTLVIYIQGDNGASAEGTPQGLLNEMSIFNNIPEDFKQVMAHMDELGGPTTFNHYPVGWAHAMDTPFQWTKQVASHFGGTRNGLVISWPARIKDKGGIRTQFQQRHRHLSDHPRSRRRAIALGAQRCTAEAGRRREHGLHLRRRKGAIKAPDAIFRDVRQPRHLQRRLGRRHHAARLAMGRRRAHTPMTTSGNCTT